MTRKGYLDWLRGVATLLMIEAHTMDAWTLPSERDGWPYRAAIVLGGFAAPAFMCLAGVALALAAVSRERRGKTVAEVAALARRRGWQIFGLAFLFRLQALVISGGRFPQSLLKVDILNVLGLSMLAAALLWGLAKTRAARIAVFVAAAAAVAAIAPAIRASTAIAGWPDPLEWYFQPWTGKSSFTLSPWPAFLFAGVAVGEWLDAVRTAPEERRATWHLGALGAVLVAIGYAATFFPPVYDNNGLWTVAPSFVGLRLGILLMALPAALALALRRRGHSVLEEFGVSSLFVYWIHVEMVYGIVSMSLHRKLTVPQAGVAYVLLCVLLFGLVRFKNRVTQSGLKAALYIPTRLTRPTRPS